MLASKKVVRLPHAARPKGRHDTAEGRDRDLARGRGAVDIAVVAEADFHESIEAGGTDLERGQVAVDALLHRLWRVGVPDVLELALGILLLTHLEIGAGDLGAGLGVIRIDGEDAFEGENRLLPVTGVERCDTQEVIEFDFAGAPGCAGGK